jgi:hypothetical protein
MISDITELRHALARCYPIIERDLEAHLSSHCQLDYPNGVNARPAPLRDTLEEDVQEDVEGMEEALRLIREQATFQVGARMRLTREIDIFDLGRWPVGTTGTVTWAAMTDEKLDDGLLATIRIDGDHPALAEWDGCLQVFLDHDGDAAWWKWEPVEHGGAWVDDGPHRWAWCSVETPSVFREYRFPDDPSRAAWTAEHKAQWAELEKLAEQHGTSVRSSQYRRG